MHRSFFAALIGLLSPALLAADHHVFPGQSIQAAINGALNGDRVLIHSGTYSEAINFLGKDLEVIGIDGAAATTLDATSLGVSVVTLNAGEPPTSRLRGLHLTGGTGTPFLSGTAGGGVFASLGATQVVGCWIDGNTANYGGGVYGGFFRDCLIENNSATSGGGAMYADLSRCVLSKNNASGNGGGFFEGVVHDCEILGNTATSGAGGYATEGTSAFFVARNTFRGNIASGLGGGLYAFSISLAQVKYCSFLANQAAVGGGVYVACSTASIWGGVVVTEHCVFSGNQAPTGSGVALNPDPFAFGSVAQLRFCTFDGDIAEDTTGSGIQVTRCSFTNNPAPLLSAGPITVTYSNVPPGHVGAGNITATPLFVDAAKQDYHLTDPSPCRFTGLPTANPVPDFEGDPRDDAPDIGADEFHPRVYFYGDPTPGGVLRLGVIGQPGSTPLLFLGLSLLDTPVATAKGAFLLGDLIPGFPILLPALPPSGALVLAGPLPASLPIATSFHAQVYLGGPSDTLTNAASALIR